MEYSIKYAKGMMKYVILQALFLLWYFVEIEMASIA